MSPLIRGSLARACNLCGRPRLFAKYLKGDGPTAIRRAVALCPRCDNYRPAIRSQLHIEGGTE